MTNSLKGMIAFYEHGSDDEPTLIPVPRHADGRSTAAAATARSGETAAANIINVLLRAHKQVLKRKPGLLQREAQRDRDRWADALLCIYEAKYLLIATHSGIESPYMCIANAEAVTQEQFLGELDELKAKLEPIYAQRYGTGIGH